MNEANFTKWTRYKPLFLGGVGLTAVILLSVLSIHVLCRRPPEASTVPAEAAQGSRIPDSGAGELNATEAKELETETGSQPLHRLAPVEKDIELPDPEVDERKINLALAQLSDEDLAKRIEYIKQHGVFSRAAQVPPAVQQALRNSEEYQKARAFIRLAKKQGEMNDITEADKNYRLAVEQYLKAAALHMDADISLCTFAAGYQLLKSVSKPDYETAYLLFHYSRIVNPNGNMAEHYNLLIREIEELGVVPVERLRELEQEAREMKTVAGILP